MTSPWLLIIAILILGAVYVVVPVVLRAYTRYRGKRLVTCPETKAPAAVEVNARRAALAAAVHEPIPRLQDCSRWPEREHCGQECLTQIQESPDGCLIQAYVARWYGEKVCAFCSKPIGEIRWYDRRPALLNAEGGTVQWDEVRVEALPEVLKAHRPVCWSCHVAETFRREHPDMVVDRPWKGAGPPPA